MLLLTAGTRYPTTTIPRNWQFLDCNVNAVSAYIALAQSRAVKHGQLFSRIIQICRYLPIAADIFNLFETNATANAKTVCNSKN